MRIIPTLAIFFVLYVVGGSAQPLGTMLSGFLEAVTNVFTPRDQFDTFWDEAQKLGPRAGHIVLDKVASVYAETAHAVGDLKHAMDQVVGQAREVHTELQVFIKEKNITMEHFSEILAKEVGGAYQELRDEVVDPLPGNRGERAKTRAQLVSRAMAKTNNAYVRAMVEVGVPHEQAEDQFNKLSPKITHVLLVTGNIIDNHPKLLEVVVFAASMLLLPEIQILRPVMSIFGFGPLGPVKGSAAAWLQSRFWGGFVTRGSWFAILQKVGMTLTGSWYQRFLASAGLAAALGIVTTRSCL